MHWPRRPVETIPPDEFHPPFCPHQDCPVAGDRERARFHDHGVFIRKSDRRVVPRFRCLVCKRTCSLQTFSTTYYLKRPDLLEPIARGLVAGSAHRQLARSYDCAPTTVTRQAARLGRHAILLAARCLKHLPRIAEPIAYDDFECFAWSQDLPMGIGTAVGQKSWFGYGLERAPHRIGGIRARRKRVTTAAKTPEKRAYARAFAAMLDVLLAVTPAGETLEVVSDGHTGYRAGLARHPQRRRVRHDCFPNPRRGPKGSPPSTEARRRDREMFAVDLMHKLIRHSQAHHHRETIAFGRRHNAVLERAFHLMIWRNLVKARTERRPDPTTPAMWIGLTDEPWNWRRVLAQRLFVWREEMPQRWKTVYGREWLTPEMGVNRRHTLSYAV